MPLSGLFPSERGNTKRNCIQYYTWETSIRVGYQYHPRTVSSYLPWRHSTDVIRAVETSVIGCEPCDVTAWLMRRQRAVHVGTACVRACVCAIVTCASTWTDTRLRLKFSSLIASLEKLLFLLLRRLTSLLKWRTLIRTTCDRLAIYLPILFIYYAETAKQHQNIKGTHRILH